MRNAFRALYRHRELLMAFTIRHIQIKYKQTFFGCLWAIFLPAAVVLSGLMVKLALSTLSRHPLRDVDILSVSVKALPWAFFIGALRFSVGSLVSNMHILKKASFPRVIFPLGYTLGQLFDFAVASIAFGVVLVVLRVPASPQWLWLPVILLSLILLTTGLGIALSAANLFFRDVKHLIDVVLTFAIFFTPVFFDAKSFERWGTWLLLNPVGAMLECVNAIVAYRQAPDLFWVAYSACWGIAVFLAGWAVFHKVESLFAEHV